MLLGGMTIGKEAQVVITIEENAALFTLSQNNVTAPYKHLSYATLAMDSDKMGDCLGAPDAVVWILMMMHLRGEWTGSSHFPQWQL